MGRKQKYITSLFFVILLVGLALGPNSVYGFQLHTVKQGETIHDIATDYDVMPEELLKWNQLLDEDLLYLGQAILIPEDSKDIHIVKEDGCLKPIADRYGFDIEEVKILNDGIEIEGEDKEEKGEKKEKDIKVYRGQEIILPRIVTSPPGREYNNFGPGFIPDGGLLSEKSDDFFIKGCSDTKRVALTFDDGPDSKYTTAILDVLAEYDVPGTFYYLGENMVSYPEITKRTVEDGHELGNHSWSHPNLKNITEKEVKEEVFNTHEIIKELTGVKAETFRPPFGAINKELVSILSEEGYKTVNWSIDTWDWWNKDSDKILINVLRDLHPGAIILMHSSGGGSRDFTVEALSEIIHNLKLRGYDFVTVSDIL